MTINISNSQQQLALKSKLKKNHEDKYLQECNSHVYACFQQPQTINIIPYLTMPTPNKLYFDSNQKKDNPAEPDLKERFDKKPKQFKFSKIYQRQQKFKYAFSQQINLIISKLFKGFSQTVFIYGTQQSKKDKILIGQSQNSGLLLTVLSQIFQYCHEKQIQDEVTIKLSCNMYKNGQFTDVFGIFDSQQIQKQCSSQQQKQKQKDNSSSNPFQQVKKQLHKQNINSIFCDDKLQKKYFLGVPQIIIRNMRTGLKIINLICKKMQERRDQHEANTQNLIYTIKLELDTGYDRHTGQVFQYSIPKLHIIKLANPSVDNTLNGISKNNQWFINLFNFLQTQVRLQKNQKRLISQNAAQINGFRQQKSQFQKLFITSQKEKHEQIRISSSSVQKQDEFTTYIKDVALCGVSDIHCFTSITNKMTSNECLTAFIFNNYILSYKTKPIKTILNIHLIKEQKSQIQMQLLNLYQLKYNDIKKQKQIMGKTSSYISNSNFNHLNLSNLSNLSKQKKQSKQSLQKILFTNSNTFSKTRSNFNLKNASNTYTNATTKSSNTNRNKNRLQTISGINQQQILEESQENKFLLLKYIQNLNKFTQACNIVEYEYSLVLGAACQKLNKYIFNEQIQEFYYAKKVSTQISTSLKQSVWNLIQKKKHIGFIKQKMIKKINTQIIKLQTQIQNSKNFISRSQVEEVMKLKKQRMFHLTKERQIYIKLFQMYDTMAYHYIYQNNKTLMENLLQTKLKIQSQLRMKNNQINKINYEEILNNIKKGFKKRIQEKKMKTNIIQQKEQNNQYQNQQKKQQQNEQHQQEQENQQQNKNEELQQLNQNQNQKKNNIQNKNQNSNQKQQTLVTKSLFSKNTLNTSFNKTVFKSNQNSIARLQNKGESIWRYKKRKNYQDQLQNMFTNSNVGRMSKTLYK